jgi:peptide-methionine (S)-S-oxide reductase
LAIIGRRQGPYPRCREGGAARGAEKGRYGNPRDGPNVSYRLFFAIAHDPTELNRQGPDEGTQYRSSIFYVNEEQKQVATAYIKQLNDAKVFRRPIVTTVVPLEAFYPAEAYHQNFLVRNPTYPYIVYNDLPKVKHLEQEFPAMVKGK